MVSKQLGEEFLVLVFDFFSVLLAIEDGSTLALHLVKGSVVDAGDLVGLARLLACFFLCDLLLHLALLLDEADLGFDAVLVVRAVPLPEVIECLFVKT